LVATALFLSTACGPAQGTDSDSASGSESESESATESESDSATESGVLQCYLGEDVLEIGEELETPDGCLTYRCDDGGVLSIIDDGRVNIPGDLTLATQEDVDAQVCLGVVEGALTISGTAADLTPLAQLTRVGGKLEIRGSAAVTLTGLETLGEVGDAIVIADNQSLTAMSFLPYMSVFGDVTIQNNDALGSLAGAAFLGQCGNCAVRLQLGEGEATTGGSDQDPGGDGGESAEGGLDGGDTGPTGGTFYGNILIADNDVLTDISAMGALVFAWADVRFRNNAALTSLAALQLSEVRGSLEISDHSALDSAEAEAFADVIDVWGTTTVCGNAGGTACP
jgi:hypothetical protein